MELHHFVLLAVPEPPSSRREQSHVSRLPFPADPQAGRQLGARLFDRPAVRSPYRAWQDLFSRAPVLYIRNWRAAKGERRRRPRVHRRSHHRGRLFPCLPRISFLCALLPSRANISPVSTHHRRRNSPVLLDRLRSVTDRLSILARPIPRPLNSKLFPLLHSSVSSPRCPTKQQTHSRGLFLSKTFAPNLSCSCATATVSRDNCCCWLRIARASIRDLF